ncbi:MAG: ribonuclease D [Proteobacteria bacterium]|nr:ribonuclease D [Pseudomonadota bacterium]MDA1135745.1 ribonuclease D [Pseudomonadota bacterium]|tara:strand:+ start:368 stop:1522 length:1155 start_codon:yes stop_codon:yes gene_type:complete
MKISKIPIKDNDTLYKFYNQCINEKVLAIDTEFIRENTYYPSLCLIQIAGSDFASAIDPFSGIDLSIIWKLLANKNILKVFHAAKQDIEIFLNLTGEIPYPIYDTQIAAMFCGLGDQIGYEGLVNKFLGLSVNKELQFTNWLQRPLSKNQIDYAISDVTHLMKIYPLIEKLINKSNRTEWVEKEMQSISDQNLYEIDPFDIWKRIKLKNSKPKTLNLLKYLAAWRENECKEKNIPRNKLIRDEVLVNVSYQSPQNIVELKKIRAFPKQLSHKNCNDIIETIQNANKIIQEDWPNVIKTYKKSNISSNSVELLRLLLKVSSEESGLAEKLIANSDDLRDLIDAKNNDLRVFKGWRNDVFGKEAISLLNGNLGFRLENGQVKKIQI